MGQESELDRAGLCERTCHAGCEPGPLGEFRGSTAGRATDLTGCARYIQSSTYYFSGIKGQRAVLLLSDGKDEVSRFGFAETLEFARRAGVTIYSIGLAVNDGLSRRGLIQLANETGGRSYFIRDIGQLPAIYQLVEQDLRSQYLIAYQSENSSQDNKFRTVELKVDRPRTTVRTLSGYYP